MFSKLRNYLFSDAHLTSKEFVAPTLEKTSKTIHTILRVLASIELCMFIIGLLAFNLKNPRAVYYLSLYAILFLFSTIGDFLFVHFEKTKSYRRVISYANFYYLLVTCWGVAISSLDITHKGSAIVAVTTIMSVSFFLLLDPIFQSVVVLCDTLALMAVTVIAEGKFSTAQANIIIFGVVTITVIMRHFRFSYNSFILEAKLTNLAKRDGLTSIANRNALNDRISAGDFKDVKSVALLDIDDFKGINDTKGHLVGDDALLVITSSLRENFRDRELFRYGGDEFLILSNSDCKQTLEKLKKINKKLSKIELDVSLHVSGGICELKPGISIKSTIKTADDALYQVKKSSKGRFLISDK